MAKVDNIQGSTTGGSTTSVRVDCDKIFYIDIEQIHSKQYNLPYILDIK